MRRVRPAVATSSRTLDAPLRSLPLDTHVPDREPGARPTPSTRPCAAERIREALQLWLEEDM